MAGFAMKLRLGMLRMAYKAASRANLALLCSHYGLCLDDEIPG